MARRAPPAKLFALIVLIVLVVLARRRYFEGKTLDVDDLSAEQQYRDRPATDA